MKRYWEPPEAGLGGPDAWTGGPGHPLPTRADEEITEAARAALRLEPDVDERRFVVHVRDGVVHLFGVASSERERELAVQAVEAVAGVTRVEAEVQVEARAKGPTRTEAEERAERARREGWPVE